MAGRFRGITQRGQGWQISFTLPSGKRCREVVRFPLTRKGEEEAHRFRSMVLYEIDTGTFDYAERFPRSKQALQLSVNPGRHVTIGVLLRKYLIQHETQLAASTLRDYAIRTYAHLLPTFGHLSLEALTTTHVRDWIAASNLSNKSINNVLIPLRQVYREAYEGRLIAENPLDRIRNLPVSNREPAPFTRTEVTLILRHLARRSVVVKNYFQFAFASGLRTSELIALTWSDIDLERGQIYVCKAKVRGKTKQPKTRSGKRTVDLLPMARAAVESQLRHRNAISEVFYDPRSGAPWKDDQALRKVYWYPALETLDLKLRNPYQTRHTFASQLLSSGTNPLYVAAQMGHKDWGMIRTTYGRYIHA